MSPVPLSTTTSAEPRSELGRRGVAQGQPPHALPAPASPQDDPASATSRPASSPASPASYAAWGKGFAAEQTRTHEESPTTQRRLTILAWPEPRRACLKKRPRPPN